MRLLYLTAHLSDVDLAQQALEKSAPGNVRLEACASVRDLGQRLAQGPADAIVADLTALNADLPRSIADIRGVAPAAIVVALVRQGTGHSVAEALLAGADEALVKQREFFLQFPAAVAQATSRRQVRARLLDGRTVRVLYAGGPAPAEAEGSPLRFVAADDEWWLSPAEKTMAFSPDAVVLDERKGATPCVTAIRSLRERGTLTPVVVLCDAAAEDTHAAYFRAGAAACLPRAEAGRLRDTVERAIETTRLSGELALLRSKEQRLRALIEAIPTPVTMISSAGTVQAMNFAGLALIGAKESAEVVGRPFTAMCDPAAAGEVTAFLRHVCAGTAGQIRFPGPGFDGIHRVFDLRAVPMRRDRDAASVLGVMRLAPASQRHSPAQAPGGAASADVDVEIPLDTLLEQTTSPDPAVVEALRLELDTERMAHQQAEARLQELDEGRLVSEAAWNAVQSELERKLILQFNRPAMEQEHQVTRSLLEKSLRDRDAELAALTEQRDRALSRLRHLESVADEAKGSLVAREHELERARTALEQALAARTAADRDRAEQEARAVHDSTRAADALARAESLQHELEAATKARGDLEQHLAAVLAENASLAMERDRQHEHLSAATSEVAQLRALADIQVRDQSVLHDVRAQVARLQAAASTVEQQQQALDEASSHIERLRDALEDALGARTEIELRLRDRQAAFDELARQLDAATAARSGAESTLADARAEASAARDELSRTRRDLEEARAELAALAERHRASEASGQALAGEAEAWQGRVHAMREELDAARAAVEAYRATRADLETLERDLAASRLNAEQLQAEIDSMRPSLSLARSEADELATTLTAEYDRALADKAKHDEEMEQLRADLERARGESTAARGEIDLLRSTVEEAATDRAAFEAALAAERTQAASLRAELELVADQLRRELDEHRRAADQAREQLGVLRPALDDAQAGRASVETRLAEVERARAALTAELDSLRVELEAAHELERARDAELAKLQQDRNGAVLELSRERSLRNDLQQARAAADEHAASVTARLAGIEHDLASSRATLSAAWEERNALRQAVEDATAALARADSRTAELRQELDERLAEAAARQATVTVAEQEIAALRSAAQSSAATEREWQERLERAESARRAAFDDQQSLRDQIADLQAQLAGQRRTLAEVEAQRDAAREAQVRYEAGAQLLAARHHEELDAVKRSLADLGLALSDAEAAWQRERTALQAALDARAAERSRLADSAVVGTATTSGRGRVLDCNDTLARLCGYDSASALLDHPDGGRLPLGIDWYALASQVATATHPLVVDSCVQHPDGRIVWLQASPVPVAGATGVPPRLEWTVVDATDRYLRWRQLRQAQRLDAIRELTLSAGSDVLERLTAAVRSDVLPPGREESRSLARARDIAQQLVAFAQRQARLPQLVDLNDTLVQLSVTLRRLAGSDVTVSPELSPGAILVSVDPGETEQWVTSLVVAARDALPAGGTLVISTQRVDLTAAGDAGQRRITPTVRLSIVVAGFGVRPLSVPATLSDVVVQRGGTLRASHAPESSSSRFEMHLPVVQNVHPADGAFPLARAEAESVPHAE
jgi:PAS domain-containing protein